MRFFLLSLAVTIGLISHITLSSQQDKEYLSETAVYQFGTPTIIEDEATGKWTATLPGNGLNILSVWEKKPEVSLEGVSKGQIFLQHLDNPSLHYLHGIAYIFNTALDPTLSESKEPLVDTIIKQLILIPTEEAKKEGYEVELKTFTGQKTEMEGIVLDKRFHRLMKKEGKEEAHFYRIIVGKDFVIVGMVLTAYEEKVSDANIFLDKIVIESKM